MFSNFVLLVGAILLGLSAALSSNGTSADSTWVQSKTAPSGNWYGVASDSTGKYLIAASSAKGSMATGIYLSNDGAVTWTNIFISGSGVNEQWNDVASSSDGYFLYAVQQNFGLFYSANQGKYWSRTIIDSSLSYANYNRVSCSSSGAVVAVSVMGGYIYTSNNFGYTFTPAKTLGTGAYYFVSVSANGYYMTTGTDWLYTSMNGGSSWIQNSAPNQAWTDVAYSSGSFYAVAVAEKQTSYGGIYLSSDNGNTWNLLPAANQNLNWASVTIDSTGARITAVASTDGVYYSTDFGKTFTKGTLPSGNSYKSLAGSADGSFNVVTSVYSGGIFYTTN